MGKDASGKWKNILATAVGSIGLLMTLLPLSKADHWWIRIFDYPRLQITFFLLLGILFFIFLYSSKRWEKTAWLSVLGLAFIYQATWIYPYTILAREQVKAVEKEDYPSIKLLMANVLMENRNSEPLHKIIRREQPDIILLLEPDTWWKNQFTSLHGDYPYRISQPQDNTYGILFYSRFPLEGGKVNFWVDPKIPSIQTWVRYTDGREIALYGIHPTPPVPGHNDDSTERDAELIMVAREVKDKKYPIIVIGDLNDVAWSHTTRLFQRISQLLDPRIGRGTFNTFPSGFPIIRWPLDHIFHSEEFELASIQVLEDIGSDHFPILVDLAFTGLDSEEKKVDSPSPQDLEEGRETIEKVK